MISMRNFCAKKNTRTCKRFLLGRNYKWYCKLIISIRWQSSNNDKKDIYWLIKSDDDKYKCNSFLFLKTLLYESVYLNYHRSCSLWFQILWHRLYWGNYPIQLLVTEWFVSTFPSYIAIVYSLSLVLYIQQYNISVDFFFNFI